MLEELQWDSLAMRRKASRLAIFSRVYNQESCLEDLSTLVKRAPHEHLRHTHNFRVNSITSHKNVGHYSFVPRTIRDWNMLPKEIMSGEVFDSPAVFRSAVLRTL